MAKVVRVEKLGDVCAFKPSEIQVVGNVYDRIPSEEIENLEVVVNNAKSAYDAKVAAAKAAGEKPKSAQFKAEAVAEFITPFLSKFGVEGKKVREKVKVEKVITAKDPKITDSSDPVQVDLTEVQKKTAQDYYDNNFSDEMLDDSVDLDTGVGGVTKSSDASTFLGEVSDDFDLDDDFDFEGL